jgi:hypothetical protein
MPVVCKWCLLNAEYETKCLQLALGYPACFGGHFESDKFRLHSGATSTFFGQKTSNLQLVEVKHNF